MLRLLTSSLLAVCMFVVTACTTAAPDGDEGDATADELQSTPLATSDMTRIRTPAGMPEVWDQPDSTGWLEERGKCGPTAVANTLRLYGIEVSPKDADRDGVHWVVGSRGIIVEKYLVDHHPRLGCSLEHPQDGAAFLREKVAGGHPVMVWYNTAGGFLQSHWVTVVGVRGEGANEAAIVMTWGGYYTIPMAKLVKAWRNVYWIRHPSVVCDAKTEKLAR